MLPLVVKNYTCMPTDIVELCAPIGSVELCMLTSGVMMRGSLYRCAGRDTRSVLSVGSPPDTRNKSHHITLNILEEMAYPLMVLKNTINILYHEIIY